MSDISIPGVNSRFNTETLVQDLLDVETIPLDRMRGQRDDYQNERRVWQEFNVGLNSLRTSTRELFSFENPFNERNAISSNEAVLRAEANREAVEGTTRIKIFQTAQADRFLSQEIDEDWQIGQGIYRFSVGDESLTLRFRGGSVKEFSDALNRRSPDLIRSSVVRNRPGSQVILIESLKEGAPYPLSFEEDAAALAEELGLVERSLSFSFTLPTEAADSNSVANSVSNSIRLEEGEIVFAPGVEDSIPLSETLSDTTDLILQYEVRLAELGTEPVKYQEPRVPDLGSVSLRDVILPNLPSVFPAPEEEEAAKVVEEDTLIFALNGNRRIPLPDVPESDDFIRVQLPISEYASNLDALEIRNTNSHRELRIRNVEIVSAGARGDIRPRNAISTARNALLEVEGIPVERESNSIDDLIPGVTLELRGTSNEDLELRVEPDVDLVKESLIEWVARYNQIIRDTNILTRRNQEIIDEIEYFTDEERETQGQRLGIFQGDNALNTLKQRLQNFTSSSYPTRAGRDLSLLQQIGISTNASRGNTGFNISQLRGYLEINEATLDETLANNFLAIKDLFGIDSDADLVIDRGIGYRVDQLLKSYVETGGIVSTRTSRYDTLISSSADEIQDYEEYLERYEDDLKRQFATMESAINSLESSSQGIQNLNPNSNRNNN